MTTPTEIWPALDPGGLLEDGGLATLGELAAGPWGDPTITGSPAWWVVRLDKALSRRQREVAVYQAYYSGKHRLAFATEKYRQRFGKLFEAFADNWMELVVQVAADRLAVQGFRVPSDPTDVEPGEDLGAEADSVAWEIWQRNELDSGSQLAHIEAMISGCCYSLTWPGDDGKAQITIEHPSQMIAEPDAAYPSRMRAAWKRWKDDSGEIWATLYLPGGIFKFTSGPRSSGTGAVRRWLQREAPDETWPLPNPWGVVPVRPLPNEPQLLNPGTSEIRQVIPIQDAVNKLFADMIIASEYQSFRQRAITGIEIPRDPETNEPMPDFYKQLLEKVWLIEGENVRVQELGQVDLGQYTTAIEMAVNHIASRTQTPPHYFYIGGTFPSGEALKSAEAGLVAKSRRKALHLGENWEATIRFAALIDGEAATAESPALETIWRNPETRNDAQVADAAVKMQDVGVPEEVIWEFLGLSPQQIVRAKALRKQAEEQGPPTPPVPPSAPAGGVPQVGVPVGGG